MGQEEAAHEIEKETGKAIPARKKERRKHYDKKNK